MKFKKIGKIATLAVTVGVAGAVGFGAAIPQNASVYADSYTSVASAGQKLQLKQLKTQFKASDIQTDDQNKQYVVLTTPLVSEGDLNVTAKNSAGKDVTVTKVSDEWRLYLSNDKGDYSVTYSVVSGGYTTESKNVTVSIEAKTPGFVFEDNAAQIIPSKINPGRTFAVPYPSIIDKDVEGDEIVYMVANVAGQDIELTSKNIAAIKNKANFDTIGLTLKLKNSNNVDVSASCLSYDATTGLFNVNLPNDAITGKWTLTYTYSGANTFAEKKVYQFQVLASQYFNPSDINLKISGFKDSKSIPSSMELNVEAQFPYLNIINKEDSSTVETYQILSLTCSPKDGSAAQSWNSRDNPELFKNFKFKPTIAGDYSVSYTVYDAYGNTLSHTYSTIGDVKKGTTNTTVYLVKEYSVDDVEDLTYDDMDDAFYGDAPVLEKADFMIPTKVKTDADNGVTLPAIFAVDLTDNYSTLKFYRRVTAPNGTSVTYSIYESEASGRKVDPQDTISYKFATAGTYTIRYYVIDSAGSSVYYENQSVIVEDDYEDVGTPSVEFTGCPSSIIAGNTFTFEVDAHDYKDAEKTIIEDASLELIVEYKIGSADFKKIYPNSEGKYEIEVPADTAAAEVVTIRATAKDDFDQSDVEEKEVIVKSYAGDVTPPTITSDFNFDIEASDPCWSGTVSGGVLTLDSKQKGDFVTLPSITFNDADSDNLSVTAYVEHIGSGNIIKTYSGMSGSAHDVTLGGLDSESFQLAQAGDYRVNYVATDANNNILLYSFQFNVVSNTPPTIYGVGSISTEAEYGDVIDIVSGITVYDNDTAQTGYATKFLSAAEYADIDTTLAAAAPETLLVYVEGAYTPKQADENKIIAGSGTITLHYWAKNAVGTVSANEQVQTIAAKDTKAPTFYVDETKMDATHDFVSGAADLTNYVFIADMEALKDTGVGVDLSSKSITAKYSDTSSEITVKTDILSLDLNLFDGETTEEKEANRQWYADNYYGYVVATKNGTISITYSLSDKAGNAAALKTIDIACGDITAPSISINDVPFETSYSIGGTLSIDRTKIVVSDDKSAELTYNDVTIKVTCDGATVEKTNSSSSDPTYTYSLSKAGSYVITFTVSDEAGNQASTTKEFTISATPESPAVSTTVWGTILIIAALLVLGGVIYFFVKPAKGKGSKRKAEKKEPEDKIEV